MQTNFWIIVIVVVAFLGFMMGYAFPPFMEVGFGQGGKGAEVGTASEEELMKQYEELYEDEDSDTSTE